MKKAIIFILSCTAFSSFGQDDPEAIGYKLKVPSKTILRVYQEKSNSINTSIWNQWVYNYWFKIDESENGKIKIGNTEYIRITIPSGYSYNQTKKRYEPEPHFNNPIPWVQEGVPVDSDDFNSWLWISKVDFEKYKKYAYKNHTYQFVFSGLTIPFKYRLKTKSQNSSMLTGDINLGTFVGFRIAFGNTGGISLGGSLGITSLTQNSSNNTAIVDNKSESISGINYGGGIVFDWQNKFQIGAILGFDHGVGNLSKSYIYQNKGWLAISLNYKFLDFGKSKNSESQSENTEK